MSDCSSNSLPALRVVVVGPCASGKSTLVAALKELGVDAYVCAQEHSEVASLWKHTEPDLVVSLIASLETVRARRGEKWSHEIYERQQFRLREARNASDIALDTGVLATQTCLEAVVEVIKSRGETPLGDTPRT